MTLIASQLLLSRNDVAQLRLHDAYALHRVVYSLFEDTRAEGDPTASAGFLYADAGQHDQDRRVLLLSNRPPRARVADRYGRVTSRLIAPGFLGHSRYRFQVVMNPVTSKSRVGSRHPIRQPEAVQAWFAQKAPQWGFEVFPDALEAQPLQVQRLRTAAGHGFVLSQSLVRGTLAVTDPDRFTQAFAAGIGRGRAFGCGLLQLKPLLPSASKDLP